MSAPGASGEPVAGPATGPAVVAVGGGHGLAATLTAARRYAGSTTAVVSVADDGGSSGRLREALGIPAPGDLRRCLVALGDPASVWGRTFEHRFTSGELAGHALGNLVIAGLAQATGDFTTALREAGKLVGAVGRVLPATVGPVVLKAESAAGPVEGQVAVSSAARISSLSLVPPDAEAPAAVVEAIAAADQVVLGPGSLYTSVLAAAIVPAVREALATTRARVVHVANLRTQPPETEGYDVGHHVDALLAHGVRVDVVVHDPSALPLGRVRVPVVEAAVGRAGSTGHDPERLAEALSRLVG